MSNDESRNPDPQDPSTTQASRLPADDELDRPLPSPHSFKHRVGRVIWGIVQGSLFRWSPRPCFRWRRMLLSLFGAKMHPTARVYPLARILVPWNLEMDAYATLADHVDCFTVAKITIGRRVTVSQYSYLCSATHDFEDPKRLMVPIPITLGARSWIAADVFVGPGVTVGEGTVVGARSSVFKDLPPWKVCAGSPAKPIRDLTPHTDPEA